MKTNAEDKGTTPMSNHDEILTHVFRIAETVDRSCQDLGMGLSRCLNASSQILHFVNEYFADDPTVHARLWLGAFRSYSTTMCELASKGELQEATRACKSVEEAHAKGLRFLDCEPMELADLGENELGGHAAVIVTIDQTEYMVDVTLEQFKRDYNVVPPRLCFAVSDYWAPGQGKKGNGIIQFTNVPEGIWIEYEEYHCQWQDRELKKWEKGNKHGLTMKALNPLHNRELHEMVRRRLGGR